jgi:hypothetical protein
VTDGQSVSKYWYRATSGTHDQIFSYYHLTVTSPLTTRRVTVSLLSESESDVTTDGQSASLSCYKAPIRGLRPDFHIRTEYGTRLTVTFMIPWGALSDERTGLSFVCAAGPCQRSLSRVLVPWDLRPYFTVSQIWDFPFRRLLRLAGSRGRYSTPPPHGCVCSRIHEWTPFYNRHAARIYVTMSNS